MESYYRFFFLFCCFEALSHSESLRQTQLAYVYNRMHRIWFSVLLVQFQMLNL